MCQPGSFFGVWNSERQLLLSKFVEERNGKVSDFHVSSFQRCPNIHSGSGSEMDPSYCSLHLLVERMKGKDLKLLEMNKENEVLKIKVWLLREISKFL